jgi:asparagine synthase (glutamine-hydrolysing)
MCGFTGVIAFHKPHPYTSKFMEYAMHDLYRRGPDTQNIWISEDDKIQLGFARLAIRDISTAGNQPMLSEDKRWVLMFNGEVYNTSELIKWAGINIENLNGHSDTEIILKSVEIKGVHETICRLDGIFAIAILDVINGKIYLIRDQVGVKPLYIGINYHGVIFSSHYHQIMKHPYFENKIVNPSALIGYFKYGFIQENDGLFEDTYFLPHGHITELDVVTGDKVVKPFDSVNLNKIENLENTFKKVINSQLISDVPIGTFLSGGIDSSLTTACASESLPGIIAFTIGVNDPKLDETTEAKRIADNFPVKHQIIKIEEESIISAINQYDDSLAEPLADYSSLLMLKICEIAKKNLTVVLSGDGGDELYFGYIRMFRLKEYMPFLECPWILRAFKIGLARLFGKKVPFRLMKFKNLEQYYLSAQGLTGNKDWMPRILVDNQERNIPFQADRNSYLLNNDKMNWAREIEKSIHLQRVLLKVDRASMYHSLEVRTPFLSTPMFDNAEKYSYDSCVIDEIGKMPLRDLLKKMMPNTNTLSEIKKGFEPPMGEWLRGALKSHIESRISNIPIILKGHLKEDGIKQIWKEHQSEEFNHSWSIWAIYSLFTWLEKVD